jgi:2-polyprenyl-6-hydroxyphenyl methylase/3-demethylubiquinone-9 3-methyltransferase
MSGAARRAGPAASYKEAIMSKITPFLWYDGNAEEAANFYVTLFPDSKVDNVARSPADTPSGPEGYVLLVEFTLAGQPYVGLNGGPQFPFTEAVSFQVKTADQEETDRLWNALIADGGAESACGWLKDRWGLSWQITPRALTDAIFDPDPAAAKRAFNAMMEMGKIDIAAIEAARRG